MHLFISNPCLATAIVFVFQNLFYGQLPHLLSFIERERLAEFSRRDAMRLCRSFKTADSLQPVLNRLCEYGYIAVKPQEQAPGIGRRPSEGYVTNPAVLNT